MDIQARKDSFSVEILELLAPLQHSSVYPVIERLIAGERKDLWEIALVLGNFYNSTTVPKEHTLLCKEAITKIREFQGVLARESTSPTTVIFGTSGWREQIGEGFTLLNVHKVVRAIIEMMKTETFLKDGNYKDFSEVQQAGVLLLRDNRFMGDEFIEAAKKELVRAGCRVFIAGECPTGVGSAVLTELRGAGSINFTPSHNSMDYAGLKFNPRDGGPADPSLTTLIEKFANQYMTKDSNFEKLDAYSSDSSEILQVNAKQIFKESLDKSKVFDPPKLRQWLVAHRESFYILVDTMHGSSRGYIEHLLGPDIVAALTETDSLSFKDTEDDYSFHGIKPEPSAKNQRVIIDALQQTDRKLTLGVSIDPDADRIRFADAFSDIDMNRFAAIAYANLLKRGMRGGIASTLPSSDFALEIAKQNALPVFEESVGFKNFRPYLRDGRAVMAFEESDGISFFGHTLEKCALAGFLSALHIWMVEGKNLSKVYLALQNQYGYFYPEKSGEEVKGMTVEEWQQYRKTVASVLKNKLFAVGDQITVGEAKRTVSSLNDTDGLKIGFDDKSWILLRSSGTEPKFRYYYEVVLDHPNAQFTDQITAYKNAGASILRRARELVQ